MKNRKITLVFLVLSVFVFSSAYAGKYWRGQCTKNWSQKFDSYQSCYKAAKEHEKNTGHNSGCHGPY